MEELTPAMQCDAGGGEPAPPVKKSRRARARKQSQSGPAVLGAIAAAPLPPASVDAAGAIAGDDVHQRIGHLTRTLHEALRELGYDKDLRGAHDQLPDARDRLAYIGRVTGAAAERVLDAVDRARALQEQTTASAAQLHARWQAVAAYTAGDGARATPAGRELIAQTCTFFASADGQAQATRAILTEIMLAQDFHDLTGQVIRKVVAVAQSMEEQLLRLLLETAPAERQTAHGGEHGEPAVRGERLSGPVVRAEGRDDVVTDQAGVDDLLASLGF